MKYLDTPFDIHTGGTDNMFIHHNNEIAQGEAALGHKVVNYWMHGAFLLTGGEKMAKSKGEFLTLNSLIEKGFDPLDYRYFCFSTSYRKELAFSWEAIKESRDEFLKLKETIRGLKRDKTEPNGTEEYNAEFLRKINNDLDIRGALNVLKQVLKDEDISSAQKYSTVIKYDNIFGLKLSELEEIQIPDHVLKLATEREMARKNRDWELADTLRKKIASAGFVIEDTPNGYRLSAQNGVPK
jgi:cysteinyl-tRNA synthetase